MTRPPMFQHDTSGGSPNDRLPVSEFRTKVKYFLLAVATSLALWALLLVGLWSITSWLF